MKKKAIPGYSGSEDLFGGLTNFERHDFGWARPKFPVLPKEEDNDASHRSWEAPWDISTTMKITDLARWYFYNDEPVGRATIGPKMGFSNGNANEIRRTWGWDTTDDKNEMGGRYDGRTREPQNQEGREDWWRGRPPWNDAQIVDWSQQWLEYNKGDEVDPYFLYRWIIDPRLENDWPGRDPGGVKPPAEGPAFYQTPEVKPRRVLKIKDACQKLLKIAEQIREVK